MTEHAKIRPDYIRVYRDTKGEWRWTRRNAFNQKITADSAEGYADEAHTVEMAYKVNGGEFLVVDEKGQPYPRPTDG